MNIGILGTGFGSYHASIYSKMENVDSIKIWGRNEEKLREIKNDLNIEATTDMDEIINDKNIDLVDVCLPSSLHKEYAIQAMKSGKDVFCETPTALNIEDALAIKEASEKYHKKCFVDMFIRFEEDYKYIHKLMIEGTLGKLKVLYVKRETPHFWGDLSLDKLAANLMIHECDFVTYLLGPSNEISAIGVNSKDGESHISALLNYNDTAVTIHSSSLMPFSHAFTTGYEAIFENGSVEYVCDGYADREEKTMKLFTKDKCEDISLPATNSYEEAFNHVIDCCINNTPSILSIDDAVNSLKTALKIKDLVCKNE